MKTKTLTLFLTLGIIVFMSCDRNEDSTLIQIPIGDFTGIFTVEYKSGDTFSNPVTISFMEENAYSSTGNPDYYPAGGNGTFEINGSSIEFTDTNFWTANFDWNLILNGKYEFTYDGKELVISANKNDVGFYKYELTKE